MRGFPDRWRARAVAGLTDSVTWSSSDTMVATISNVAGSRGLAEGINAGMTQITARSGMIQGGTTLTVVP